MTVFHRMKATSFWIFGILALLHFSARSCGFTTHQAFITGVDDNPINQSSVEMVTRYLLANNWMRVVLFTDFDYKTVYRICSRSLIMATIFQVAPNMNFSHPRTNINNQIPRSSKVVVWCSAVCQKAILKWAKRNNMFYKQYFWIFVQTDERVLNEILKFPPLLQYLRPDSNIFMLHIDSTNSPNEQRSLRVCRLTALGSYSPNGMPCITKYQNSESWSQNKQEQTNVYLPLQGYNLTLAIMHLPPFAYVSEVNNEIHVKGYFNDVMVIIARYLGFRFTYKKSISKEYGQKNNGSWTGIIGMVQRQEVDFSSVLLGMTPDRVEDVDFSTHTSQFGIVAIILKPTISSKADADFATYTKPFPKPVWIAIAALCVFVVLCLFIAVCTKPPLKRRPKTMSWKSTLLEAMWKVVFSAVLQDEIDLPQKYSVRIVTSFLFIFTFMITVSHSSVLTASFTVKKAHGVYETIEELLDDGIYKIAVRRASMEHAAIKAAVTGTLVKMKKVMLEVDDDNEGITKAYTNKFVYLMPNGLADYFLKYHCQFTLIKKVFLKSSLHFPMQKMSPYKEAVSQKLLALHSSLTLTRMKGSKYDPNIDCPIKEEFNSIHLMKCADAFLVWSFGLCLAVVILSLEITYDRICKNYKSLYET